MPDLLTILILGVLIWAIFSDHGSDDEEARELDAYQNGLDTASRISAMAFETEVLMYRAAAQAKAEEEETL